MLRRMATAPTRVLQIDAAAEQGGDPQADESDVEDAHPARTHEQADHDEDDAPEQLPAEDGEDAGDDEDHCKNPQNGCHGAGVSAGVLSGTRAFG
jgi:hypothetical protein